MPKVLPFRVNYIDVGFPVFLIIYLFVFTVGNKVLLIYSIDQSMKKKKSALEDFTKALS